MAADRRNDTMEFLLAVVNLHGRAMADRMTALPLEQMTCAALLGK
jgi:hypothetical protein